MVVNGRKLRQRGDKRMRTINVSLVEESERHRTADVYENVADPMRSNMFVRYLLTIMSQQRVASNREEWRRWHAGHDCSRAHR